MLHIPRASCAVVCADAWRAALLQVRQLEMERFSMSKALEGGDKAAAARIKALDKQLNEFKKEQSVRTLVGCHAHWCYPAGDMTHFNMRRAWGADGVWLMHAL